MPPSAAPTAARTFQCKGCIGCINALSPPLPGFILSVIGHLAHRDILSRQLDSSHTVRSFVSFSSDNMAAASSADGATVSNEHSGGGTSAEFSVADPSAQENVVVKIGMVGDAGVGQ